MSCVVSCKLITFVTYWVKGPIFIIRFVLIVCVSLCVCVQNWNTFTVLSTFICFVRIKLEILLNGNTHSAYSLVGSRIINTLQTRIVWLSISFNNSATPLTTAMVECSVCCCVVKRQNGELGTLILFLSNCFHGDCLPVKSDYIYTHTKPGGRLKWPYAKSPGWQPTLCAAWCPICWFALAYKKYGHTWHWMSFLRPGVIKQHKPNQISIMLKFGDITYNMMI